MRQLARASELGFRVFSAAADGLETARRRFRVLADCMRVQSWLGSAPTGPVGQPRRPARTAAMP
jgi:hypothetical protein